MGKKGVRIEECPRCGDSGLLIERVTVTRHSVKTYTYKRLNVAHYSGYGISKNGKPVDRIHWCYLNAQHLKHLESSGARQTVTHNVTHNVTQTVRHTENGALRVSAEKRGSPGAIRTPVYGSKAQIRQNHASFTVKDVDWTVSDFWQHCTIDERLSAKVSKDYKNVTRRFLVSWNGVVSRQSIRQFLESYLQKAPKTYNNIIDGLRAFVVRYLQKPEVMTGFKHTHAPDNFDRPLPTKEQLQQGFDALRGNREQAIFLFFATTGLRRSELRNLTLGDVDFDTRCVKAKHDTRTKRAGVTFYNAECETYLKQYLDSRTDASDKLFRIGDYQFYHMWKKATKAAGFQITPQVLRKWHATELGELMVPDRFVDVFQGRAPRSVLAKHYTGKGLELLKRIYEKANLRLLN